MITAAKAKAISHLYKHEIINKDIIDRIEKNIIDMCKRGYYDMDLIIQTRIEADIINEYLTASGFKVLFAQYENNIRARIIWY